MKPFSIPCEGEFVHVDLPWVWLGAGGAMITVFFSLVLNAMVLFFTSYVVPGVKLASISPAIIIALVLGLLHSFVHDTIVYTTLPPNFITYFFFSLLFSSLAIYSLSMILPGLEVDGFKWVLIFSCTVSIINALIQSLIHIPSFA